jgi:hypothetical protein
VFGAQNSTSDERRETKASTSRAAIPAETSIPTPAALWVESESPPPHCQPSAEQASQPQTQGSQNQFLGAAFLRHTRQLTRRERTFAIVGQVFGSEVE